MQERKMTDPAFCSELRDTLRLGKYTRRFADMTGDEIAGLLWLLGEYIIRADPLPSSPYEELMARHELAPISPGECRRVAAHNALVATRTAPALSLEEAKRLICEAAREPKGTKAK